MVGYDNVHRTAFERLWERVPLHLQDVCVGLESGVWKAEDTDALADVLCKYEHHLSKHAMDLGHDTVDPFRNVLKPGARPIKQRPYRHSRVLAAKVQI